MKEAVYNERANLTIMLHKAYDLQHLTVEFINVQMRIAVCFYIEWLYR